jgi:alpha-methylacyl-CoA racemase
MDRKHWPAAKARLAALFKTRTCEEWCIARRNRRLLCAGADDRRGASAPAQQGTWHLCVEIDGIVQPAPAPRFSRTIPDLPIPPQPPSAPDEAETVLAPWLDPAEIATLRAAGTLG